MKLAVGNSDVREREYFNTDTPRTTPLLDPGQKLQLALANSRPDSSDSSCSGDVPPTPRKPPPLLEPPEKDNLTSDTRKTSPLLDPGENLLLTLSYTRSDSADSSDSLSLDDDQLMTNKPAPPLDPPKNEDSTSDTQKVTPLLDPGQELLLAVANSHPDKADSSDSSNSDDDPPMPSTALLPPDPPENDNPSDTPKTTPLLDPGQKLQLAQANSQLDRSDSSDCSSSGDDPPLLSKQPPPPKDSPKKEGSTSDTQKTTLLLDPGQKLQLALANTLPDSSDHWSSDDD